MKKNLLFQAMLCIATLFTLISPVSAQKANETDEYKASLKKLMELTGVSSSVNEILPHTLSVLRMNVSDKDDIYWSEFNEHWKTKIEDKVIEICMPVYKRYLSLEDIKGIASFYESPLGQKCKESALAIMREAMPTLVQQLYMEMEQEIKPEYNIQANVINETEKRDREIYDAAHVIPKDSIAVAHRPYRGEGTKPLLYSIERRAKDTKVTFLQPIYFDWQWLYYSPGFVIIDKKSGDEYHVRGYDGGAPMDRLLIVEGFNSKYIYVSLLFPKLNKSVKKIDILELPHEKDRLPSNDDGNPKSYYNINIKNYLPISNKKIYY